MSRSIVRRLTAAVTLAAALWAATPATAAPRAPRLRAVPGISLLQQAVDWFQGLFAAPAPAERQEKAGAVPISPPLQPGVDSVDYNIEIDPNG